MSRRSASVALAAALVLGTAAPAAGQAAGFTDVSSDNVHAGNIARGVELDIVSGTSTTTFSPARQVTRGQAATLVAGALEAAGASLPPPSQGPAFTDAGAPHGDAIRSLAAAEIVSGTTATTFAPGDPVTRGQLATLLVGALEFATGDLVVAGVRGTFSDVPEGGVHAANIDAARTNELLSGRGDGTFAAGANTRRDQAASLAVELVDAVERGGAEVRGEAWVLDQGTDLIHVYADAQQDDKIAEIDVRPATLRAGGFEGAPTGTNTIPHMIEFDSQERFAFIASTAGGVTIVVDARSKEVVEVLPTGPGTHMADVTPDDSAVWVAVIGDAGRNPHVPVDASDPEGDTRPANPRSFVEIPLDDLDADDPTFAIGRVLDVQELLEPWEDGTLADYEFPSYSAICHQYSPDSSEAWLTLGPGPTQGGFLVIDLEEGVVDHAYDPTEVKANCGVSVTEDTVLANWSGNVQPGNDTNGEWYVIDRESRELRETNDAEGLDTHGLRLSPDGSTYWQVNRNSDDALVIDADTFEVIDRYQQIADTPDIIDYSPDGRLLYVTQRGPNPRSGAVHSASGDEPGLAIIDTATGERVGFLAQETITTSEGTILNDIHGAATRTPRAGDAAAATQASVTRSSSTGFAFDTPRPEPTVGGFHCGLTAQ